MILILIKTTTKKKENARSRYDEDPIEPTVKFNIND